MATFYKSIFSIARSQSRMAIFYKSIFSIAAMTLVLTGCSSEVISATPTPVAYKACMSTSPAGVNDGGVNQSAYFGLQQAEAQFGVAISVVQASAKPTVGLYERALQRLIGRGCNLIFAVGGNQNDAVYAKAAANPKTHFVLVDQPPFSVRTAMQSGDYANVQSVSFDTTVAAFQAGYLAASHTKTSTVGVIAGRGDVISQAEVWFFRQGVSYFNRFNPASQVVVIGAADDLSAWWTLPEAASPAKVKALVAKLLGLGADVVFPVGVNGLAAAQQVATVPGRVVIGSGSDWYLQARYETVKPVILSSVHKVVSSEVASLVGSQLSMVSASPQSSTAVASPSPMLPVIAGQVTLVAEHSVAFGSNVQTTLEQIAKQIADSTIVLDPFPATV